MKGWIPVYSLIIIPILISPTAALAQISYVLDDIKVTSAPATAFPCETGQQQNCAPPIEGQITIFLERSEIVLPVAIGIDGTALDLLKNRALTGASLNAGSCVNSYLLVFNPSYATGSDSFTATGTVRFGTPVVGFIQGSSPKRASTFLYQSDSVLGNPKTSYPIFTDFGTNARGVSYGHARGYELDPNSVHDSIVFLDGNTIQVAMVASYPGDQLRVLTACCACCTS